MHKILMVAEKNSFFVISMSEQLKAVGYDVVSMELEINQLSKCKEEYEAVVLYIEGDMKDKTKDLIFLRDMVIEADIPLFYMGNNSEELKEVIQSHVIKEVFKRPIDVKFVAAKIDDFIKNYGRHVKKKILVVDDSGTMLRNVKGWLEDKYQVILANSGAMAIKYLAINRPDLVLLDYEMPVVDGRQVLEMIRTESEFSDIPVIFLTSKNDRDSIIKVMGLRPEGYLLKNMEPEKIVAEIDNFFEKRKKL